MDIEAITKAGGPAFPVSIPGCGDNGWHGMTLRDYFAGQMLAAAYADAPGLKDYELKFMFGDASGLRRETIAAALAYRYADAMIERRSR